ncbi:MAG: TIGR02147 family protein [Fibrobacterales bacterium]
MESRSREKDIFEFLDYQEYLSYVYKTRKKDKTYFTYRYIAGKVGIDHSLVARIFQGKRHISNKSICAFSEVLNFSEEEAEYFFHLVNYCKSEKPEVIEKHFEKMMALQPFKAQLIQESEYKLFKNWYVQAIHALLEFFPFNDDYRSLALKLSPQVSLAQAEEAITILKSLKFIERDDAGNWRPIHAGLTSGDRWKSAAIHAYHKEVLTMAANSLELHKKNQRDFSSLTISIPSDSIPKIKEVLKQTRESIIQILGEKPPEQSNAVYQVALNLFPMSRIEEIR